MVETAVRDFMLKMKGFDASTVFVERHTLPISCKVSDTKTSVSYHARITSSNDFCTGQDLVRFDVQDGAYPIGILKFFNWLRSSKGMSQDHSERTRRLRRDLSRGCVCLPGDTHA